MVPSSVVVLGRKKTTFIQSASEDKEVLLGALGKQQNEEWCLWLRVFSTQGSCFLLSTSEGWGSYTSRGGQKNENKIPREDRVAICKSRRVELAGPGASFLEAGRHKSVEVLQLFL